MNVCKLYYDSLSQPSRSVLIFCRVAGIPVEEVLVKIREASFCNTICTCGHVLRMLPCRP
jgi:hypothetical protein